MCMYAGENDPKDDTTLMKAGFKLKEYKTYTNTLPRCFSWCRLYVYAALTTVANFIRTRTDCTTVT